MNLHVYIKLFRKYNITFPKLKKKSTCKMYVKYVKQKNVLLTLKFVNIAHNGFRAITFSISSSQTSYNDRVYFKT